MWGAYDCMRIVSRSILVCISESVGYLCVNFIIRSIILYFQNWCCYQSSIVHSGQETLIATVYMHGHMHNLWFSIAWFVSILHVCLLMFTSFALKLMFFNLSQCTVSRAVCALHTDQCRLICIKKFLRLGM